MDPFKVLMMLFLFIVAMLYLLYYIFMYEEDPILVDNGSGIGGIDNGSGGIDGNGGSGGEDPKDPYTTPPDLPPDIPYDPTTPSEINPEKPKVEIPDIGYGLDSLLIGGAIQITLIALVQSIIKTTVGDITKKTPNMINRQKFMKIRGKSPRTAALVDLAINNSADSALKKADSGSDALKFIKSVSMVGAVTLLFDIANLAIDMADVDGYNNVTFKQTYMKMRDLFNTEFNELKKTAGAVNIVGPLSNIPIDILSNKIIERSSILMKPRIDLLIESYIDYLTKENITDSAAITDFVNNRLNSDINIPGFVEKATQELCTERSGIYVKDTTNYCSYSQDNCKAYKAYSWPLVINSTSPVITTSQDTINLGTYYLGADVVVLGLIDPYTNKDQIGFISDLKQLESAGLVGVSFNDRETSAEYFVTVGKESVKAVYSDTYVEWKDGSCKLADPTMRSTCYDAGINYDIISGTCNVDETYCRSKALDWKYNPIIDTYDCYIGPDQEVYRVLFGTTFTSKLIQVFDMAQYEKCKPNEIDAGYQCSSCPPGYSSDNLANAYLQASVKAGAITAEMAANSVLGIPLAAVAGIVTGLASGFNTFLNSFCYEECPPGMYAQGPVCWVSCPPEFTDYGVGCSKPNVGCGVGVGVTSEIKPVNILPCPPGTDDLAGSCWVSGTANIKPGFDPVGRHLNGTCDENYEKNSSLCYKKCADNMERNGLLCYPKCPKGQHKVGCCICSPDCPNNTVDTGASCTKTSKIRGLKFVLPRTKQRIVPFSSKQIQPITEVVDEVNPVIPPPTECPPGQMFSEDGTKCVDIACPDGKSYNIWQKVCLNTCPDPSYERFKNGLCYRGCDALAAEKGLDTSIKYIPNAENQGICDPVCPNGHIRYGQDCISCPPNSFYDGTGKCIENVPNNKRLRLYTGNYMFDKAVYYFSDGCKG